MATGQASVSSAGYPIALAKPVGWPDGGSGKLLSPEERGLWGDAFATAGPGVLDAMLAALAAGDRFAANPVAQKIVSSLPSAEATYNNKPIVLLTDTYDPITPDGNAGGFYDGVVMSKKGKKAEKKGMLKVASYYAVPPADGWTSFEDGAKSPSAALSAVKLGGSGVGHCAFTTDQTVAAVKVLAALADAKSAKKVAAAKRLGYKVPGINRGPAVRAAGLEEPCRYRRLERTTPEGPIHQDRPLARFHVGVVGPERMSSSLLRPRWRGDESVPYSSARRRP